MRVTTKTTYIGPCFLTVVSFARQPIEAMQTQVRPTAKQVRKFKQSVCREAKRVRLAVEAHIALHKPKTPADAERALKGLFAQMDRPAHCGLLLTGANLRVRLQGDVERLNVCL